MGVKSLAVELSAMPVAATSDADAVTPLSDSVSFLVHSA